jgi:hypothetical protein
MNDRELLERAAKAAGYVIRVGDNGGLQNGKNAHHWVDWHPLSDDGDALRLAVKLEIAINPFAGKTVVAHNESGRMGHEKWDCWDDDPFAATRRAIVRAAAALAEGAK